MTPALCPTFSKIFFQLSFYRTVIPLYFFIIWRKAVGYECHIDCQMLSQPKTLYDDSKDHETGGFFCAYDILCKGIAAQAVEGK